MDEVSVEVDGRQLTLSNLDKVLYPAAGFTKADVIDYYPRIAPVMLPHLRRRPLTLVRSPDGVDGESFFEKRCPPHHPDWVATGEARAGGCTGCVVDDLPDAGLARQPRRARAAHPPAHGRRPGAPDRRSCSTSTRARRPTSSTAAAVALELRDAARPSSGSSAVVKTSGGKGLHLSVPAARRDVDDDETEGVRARARAAARRAATRSGSPSTWRRSSAPGKVFVDWSQNDRHKTTVCRVLAAHRGRGRRSRRR